MANEVGEVVVRNIVAFIVLSLGCFSQISANVFSTSSILASAGAAMLPDIESHRIKKL
jgi:hypothetical protein